MRVVVTAPGEDLRRELAEIDERLVDAQEFVSLTSLLPTCQVVISHAGAGTVLASLAAGVPVILLPRGAPSQARMADACERAGVGRRCDPGGVDAALEEVMHDTRIAAAVSAAAREIAELPHAETVVAMIESLQRAQRIDRRGPIPAPRVDLRRSQTNPRPSHPRGRSRRGQGIGNREQGVAHPARSPPTLVSHADQMSDRS